MDASMTQQKAITLGEIIVRELDAHPDTLSRWMAHYIGEQMALASTGEPKSEANAQCFQTILALWSHRDKLPNGFRPLDGFEPILNTLTRLKPDEPRGFYHNFLRPQNEEAGSDGQQKAVTRWLEFAESADYTARILISLALRAAAKNATRDSTDAILEAAPADDMGVTILRRLRQVGLPPSDPDAEAAKALVESLEGDIGRLQWFKRTAERVEEDLTKALAKAKKVGW